MSKKRFFMVCAVMLAVILPAPACQPQGILSVAELTARPAQYNNRVVTVEGFFFNGFEIISFSGELVPSTFHQGNLTPKQPLIWLEGNLGEEVYNRLYTQTVTPSGYSERYGKLRITGKFQQGKFGHLDAYGYKITVSKVELLDWTPPVAPSR